MELPPAVVALFANLYSPPRSARRTSHILLVMATWLTFSPPQGEEGDDEMGDEEDFDAYNRSSYLSTPQETIIEEGEEEDEIDTQAFDGRDSSEFSIALQELKGIRSHLYSAADYCESAYIYSGQKQAILENLKDYSVKALVNAVDHVGTVAAKLDDLFSKHTKEISALEFNVSRLSRQFQTYHANKSCEGLNHFQLARRRPVYAQHYALAEHSARGETKDKNNCWMIVENTPQAGSHEQHQYDSNSDANIPNNLAWHMASETSSVSSPTGPHVVKRSTSTNSRGDKKLQGFLTRSLSGGQFSSPKSSPSPNVLSTIPEPVHSPGSSKTLSSLLSLDETRHHHDSHTHRKGLLSTFLGRTKSGKPKKMITIPSFK